MFVCEVLGLVIFHLVNTNQHSLLLRNPYYWYLTVLAIGGLVGAIPVSQLYDPRVANYGFAIFQVCGVSLHVHTKQDVCCGDCFRVADLCFVSPPIQAARLPRLLRSFKTIKRFFFKIVGDGTRLFVIILLTGIFLMIFAVINVQLFGYLEPSSQCKNNHFDNFFLVHYTMCIGT